MPSGGPRAGRPGNAHSNRQDMNQPKLAPVGKEYGQGKQVLEAQASQPLPNMQAGQSSPAGQRMSTDDLRGQIPSLSDSSARPGEPVTAGLPLGPGPGPEALATGGASNQELMILRAIFLKYPNEDIRRMIEWKEDNL